MMASFKSKFGQKRFMGPQQAAVGQMLFCWHTYYNLTSKGFGFGIPKEDKIYGILAELLLNVYLLTQSL